MMWPCYCVRADALSLSAILKRLYSVSCTSSSCHDLFFPKKQIELQKAERRIASCKAAGKDLCHSVPCCCLFIHLSVSVFSIQLSPISLPVSSAFMLLFKEVKAVQTVPIYKKRTGALSPPKKSPKSFSFPIFISLSHEFANFLQSTVFVQVYNTYLILILQIVRSDAQILNKRYSLIIVVPLIAASN